MNLSAEDLLRTKSIFELRQLVEKLNQTAQSKQSELQQMVGSKYHDFIQSADSIAAMKEKLTSVESHLVKFWDYADQVVQNSNRLLQPTVSLTTSDQDFTSKVSGTSNKFTSKFFVFESCRLVLIVYLSTEK